MSPRAGPSGRRRKTCAAGTRNGPAQSSASRVGRAQAGLGQAVDGIGVLESLAPRRVARRIQPFGRRAVRPLESHRGVFGEVPSRSAFAHNAREHACTRAEPRTATSAEARTATLACPPAFLLHRPLPRTDLLRPTMRNPLLTPEFRELIEAGEIGHHRGVLRGDAPAHGGRGAGRPRACRANRGAEGRCRTRLARGHRERDGARRAGRAGPRGPLGKRPGGSLLNDMQADDRVDLVQRLDPQVREEVLPLLERAAREDVKQAAGAGSRDQSARR
jgi:hypothetical protein